MSANSKSAFCLWNQMIEYLLKKNTQNRFGINFFKLYKQRRTKKLRYREDGVLGTDCWLSRFCLSSRASTWPWISIPFLSSGLNTWFKIFHTSSDFRGKTIPPPHLPDRILRTYKSFGLKGADAVEDHVKGAWKEPTFARWTGHGKGLTTSSNTISKQQTCNGRTWVKVIYRKFYIFESSFNLITCKCKMKCRHLADSAA